MRARPALLLTLSVLLGCGGTAPRLLAPDDGAGAGATVPDEPQLAEPPPPLPPPGTLPSEQVSARFELSYHGYCPGGCDLLPLGGQAPAALWTEVLPSGEEHFEPDARVDLYGVVLQGELQLKDLSGNSAHTLRPWQAFHAPGAGVVLRPGKRPPRMVLALVSDGEPVASLSTARQGFAKRPGKLQIIDFEQSSDLAFADGKVHARLGFEKGRASFGLLAATADAPVPPHVHDASWEVIGLLSAAGEFQRGKEAGAELDPDEAEELRDGAVVAVPKGVRHGWSPAGERALFAVQLYVPPGPEQRFRKLAAAAEGGAKAPKTSSSAR